MDLFEISMEKAIRVKVPVTFLHEETCPGLKAGGVLAVCVAVLMAPFLLKDVWQTRRELPAEVPLPPLERPWFCVFALGVLVMMVSLFILGDLLPFPVAPQATAIIAVPPATRSTLRSAMDAEEPTTAWISALFAAFWRK